MTPHSPQSPRCWKSGLEVLFPPFPPRFKLFMHGPDLSLILGGGSFPLKNLKDICLPLQIPDSGILGRQAPTPYLSTQKFLGRMKEATVQGGYQGEREEEKVSSLAILLFFCFVNFNVNIKADKKCKTKCIIFYVYCFDLCLLDRSTLVKPLQTDKRE